MAVKKNGKQRRHGSGWLHHEHKGREEREQHEREMAERLAPLEETGEYHAPEPAGAGADKTDTIRVDSAAVKMSDEFLEGASHAGRILRVDAPVLVVLALALLFMAFIAWQISLMPAK